jgi:H+/Cl- antiporter ClcA
MGATAGYSIGRLLGVDPTFMAALGFVAVFAGASNTPLACTIMAVELFGGGSLLYVGVACFVAYLASGHRGIYSSQRIATPKIGTDVLADESLEALAKRRMGG